MRSNPVRNDPVRNDPVRSDPVRSDPVRSDPVRSDPVRSDPMISDPVKSDPVRSDPVRSDPVRSSCSFGSREPPPVLLLGAGYPLASLLQMTPSCPTLPSDVLPVSESQLSSDISSWMKAMFS